MSERHAGSFHASLQGKHSHYFIQLPRTCEDSLWVIFCFDLQQRTLSIVFSVAPSCHKLTHAPQQTASYSITSSARKRIDGGTVSPSTLVVFRLMTITYFAGS